MFKKFLYLSLFCVIANARFSGEAGYGYNFYQYEEPGIMKIDGTFHTIFAKLAYINTISTEINYIQSFNANLKYNGSTQGGTPLINIPSKDSFFNIDYKIGARIGDYASYDGFGYVGIGYRYLNNRISGSGGYEREQAYYYIPTGYYASDCITSILFARYGFEFRYVFLGVNKTHIGDALPGISPSVLKMEQKHNLGFKTYVGFDFFVSDSVKIFTQLSAEYWYIRESSTSMTTYKNSNGNIIRQSWVEPKNNTIQLGIEIGLGF